MTQTQKRLEALKQKDEKTYNEFIAFLKQYFKDSDEILNTRLSFWDYFTYESYAAKFCKYRYDLKWFLKLA